MTSDQKIPQWWNSCIDSSKRKVDRAPVVLLFSENKYMVHINPYEIYSFVKTLNYVACSVMEDPKLEIMLNEETSTGPTMFFCGDDKDSKDSTRLVI